MAGPVARVLIGGNDDYHDLIGAGTALRDAFIHDGLAATLHVGIGPQQVGPDPNAVLVLYTNGMRMAPDHQAALVARVESGSGLVALHCSSVDVEAPGWHAPWLGLIGCRFAHHPPFGKFTVTPAADHPITAGMTAFDIEDELYLTEPVGDTGTVIATAQHDGKSHPIVTLHDRGKGCVCYLALGHDHRAWHHLSFQTLLTRSVRWVGRATLGQV